MNKSTKKMATTAVIGLFAVSLSAGIMVLSVMKEKSDVLSLLARNVVALAKNEDQDQCGSPTVYYNEALRIEKCHPDLSKTYKICLPETDKCCNSNSQTVCKWESNIIKYDSISIT